MARTMLPVITASGSVTEDVAVDANGDLVASGQLTITDADAGEALFNAATVRARMAL